jgi:hypothetical protein
MADFVVLRGSSIIPASTASLTLTEGTDFTLESGIASTAWFFRITNSHFTGMGRTSGGGNHNSNAFTVHNTYSGDDVVLTRPTAGSSFNCRVDWEIIQYTGSAGGVNEFIVREKSTTVMTGGGSLTSSVAVPGSVVSSSDVVPFITGQSNANTGRSNVNATTCTATLNGSNFDFERGNSSNDTTVAYALVEFTGSNWTVNAESFAESGSSGTVTLGSAVADVNETFIIDTHLAGSGSIGLDDISRRVRLSSTTQLTYESQTATGAAGKEHTVYIVENPDMSVERLTGTMAGSGEEEVLDLAITSVPDTSLVITTLSNDSTGGGTAFPRGFINHTLQDASTVRLRQADNGQTSRYALEVIQLPEGAGGTDALTAEDVESSSEVTSPSVGQEHSLTSIDVESAAETSAPAMGQVHLLIASDVESASAISTPTLTPVAGTDNLLADDVESSSEVTSPALGQVHSLSADDTGSATEVSTPALGQEHGLLADGVEADSEVSTPSLGQVHDLSAEDVESASQVSTPGLSTEGTDGLSADSVESVSEVSSPALGQVHSLTADDVQSVTEVSAPTLAETQALFANDVESLSEVSSPVLGQVHALLANDVESRSEVSAPGLDGAEEPEDIGAVPHEEKLKDYDRRAKERLAAELERLQEEKAVEKRKAKPSRIPQLDAEIAALEAEMQQMAIDAANEEIARIQEEQRRAEELRAREEEEAVAILLLM